MNTTVVYYYADPSFKWDVSASLNALKERGVRVVKGDNADELLFLLQVGRPAAVVYTLAASDSMSQANYQMVSRRALDLLVPVVAIGPDNPRDGLMLYIPEGRDTTEQHLPQHDLAATIERFAANPPSTPSRPPGAMDQKTLGKGKTILNWQAADQAESELKRQRDAGVTSPDLLPVAADKRTQQMISAAPSRPTAPTRSKAPEQPVSVPSHKKTAQMPAVAPASEPPPSAAPQPEPSVPPVPNIEIGPSEPPAAAPPPQTSSVPPRRASYWKAFVGLGAIVLLAIAAIVYFAVLPPETAPQPVPRPTAPVGISTAVPPAPTSKADDHAEAQSAKADEAQSAKADEPAPIPKPEPAPEPKASASASAEPEATGGSSTSKVDDHAEAQSAKADAPSLKRQRPIRRALTNVRGQEQTFPGHFRQGTATFWFFDDVDGLQVVDQIKELGSSASVRIVGHPTHEEVSAGQGSLGLSRAWAVEKYLVRNGVDQSVLTTARGAAVDSRDDIDDRGWPQNRWVGLIFE